MGALADWFAVTALFKYPMGIKIPHTAIIPRRKDQIGASLGEFVETNFLSEQVVQEKLASHGHRRQGRHLAVRARRRRTRRQGRRRRHPRRVQGLERRRRPGRHREHGPQAPAHSAVGTAGGPARRADLRRRAPPHAGGPAGGPDGGLGQGQPRDRQPAGHRPLPAVGAAVRGRAGGRQGLRGDPEIHQGGAGRSAAPGPAVHRQVPDRTSRRTCSTIPS